MGKLIQHACCFQRSDSDGCANPPASGGLGISPIAVPELRFQARGEHVDAFRDLCALGHDPKAAVHATFEEAGRYLAGGGAATVMP